MLSFTTALTVAAERGIAVLPYRWGDDSAARVAREQGAVLAVGRRRGREGGKVSLSPDSIRRSAGITRLVLPSPNGATVAARLAGAGATVVGVALRNADAAAAAALRRLGAGDAVALAAQVDAATAVPVLDEGGWFTTESAPSGGPHGTF
ncbi:hypothetical protein GCM10020358_38890 [Amorphoplanes nipponensis]|uniref:Uncharacterized protein n=1 Tax=Actinoplanes nipponensis TaxID=135950 RepID=A0A919JFN1_9ACTN|nr:hypothetical protein [Actinoplanes nipponensis]GIE48316.1 hypothetical protein Ani05nite_18500 [Actinoplanes nipponensis]